MSGRVHATAFAATEGASVGAGTGTGKSTPKRVAIVTGANKGIGFFIALQLASSGLFSDVLLGCRDGRRGQRAVDDIRSRLPSTSTRTTLSYLPLTLGDVESHEKLRANVERDYGKLDVLVNNAAIAFKQSDPTPFEQQTKPTLDINYRATVDVTKKLLPLLRKGTDPRIVNVASMAGRLRQITSAERYRTFQSADTTLTLADLDDLVDDFECAVLAPDRDHVQEGWGRSNYGTSKLALIAATKILAREEQTEETNATTTTTTTTTTKDNKVKVNCCCPGYCATDMSSHRGPRPASEGAKNAVKLATMDDCPTGVFVENCQLSEW